MATAWVRSLSCRSYGVADAVVAPSPSKKAQPLLPVSCGAAADVRDSVASARQAWKQQKPRRERRTDGPRERQQETARPRPKKKPKQMAAAFMPSPATAPASSAFLTMAELPEGHSSRQVVELIFSSGWDLAAAAAAGGAPEVEAMFRVHSGARAVTRFEEARATARAHGAAARCGADGNEMMRFQCRPAAGAGAGGVFSAGVATCQLGPSGSAVRTFACSGAAHARAAPSPGAGRRAMLVCRVIAGRVRQAHGDDMQALRHRSSQYDSVDMGNGELVVLDSRAVLPCFLIIYKV
ncbi:hypothetical protein D1007_28192 [Hordeum vulgare]|uniref:uncharacterized protein LOC123411492 n=1 Tax=Hordeum vulgare subsp. vulgare TaxID=112509 RepID=UPI000B46B352|nr:uncharacterized protein LOC123411492 [Hordeum vulgare subsp. vulgare]KAE8796745.1 hypothetical protein D1007_28192 [Hordeum vulgare]